MFEHSTIPLFGYDVNIYALFIGIMLFGFFYGVWKANKSPDSDFDYVDLITSTDQATGKQKASATKILQLVGGAAGTFVVIKLTLQNSITFDIFATYLAYVASIEGFSKYILARYGVQTPQTPPKSE